MTYTHKNLKIVCMKLIGKNGHTLVADLAYVIIHHLKSIYRTLVPKWHQTGYLQKLTLQNFPEALVHETAN